MKEACKKLTEAFRSVADVATKMLDAKVEFEKAKADIISNDSMFLGLKNEGQRSAYINEKLSEKVEAMNVLEVAKVEANCQLSIADAEFTTAKYLIIKEAGRLVP